MKRKKKEVLETSKISHISSIKGFDQQVQSEQEPSILDNSYHKYLKLIND